MYRLKYNPINDRWDIELRRKILWVFEYWEFKYWFSFSEVCEAVKFLNCLNKKRPSGQIIL